MKKNKVIFYLLLLFVSVDVLADGFPDFDNSGKVDVADLAIFATVWLSGGDGDENLDDIVDANMSDFAEFSEWWQWQVPSNLLVNGDFEIGTAQDDSAKTFDVDGWSRDYLSTPAIWLVNSTFDAGNQVIRARWAGSWVYQDFDAAAGREYMISVDVYNYSGLKSLEWDGLLRVEWFDASDVRIGGTIEVGRYVTLGGDRDVWVTVSGVQTAPSGTVKGRISFINAHTANSSGWGHLFYDNASVIMLVSMPPRANDDRYTVAEGGALNVDASGILANDSDYGKSVLSAVLASDASHGSLTLNADGSFSYKPEAGYIGEDSFTYRASNESYESNTAEVRITVKENILVNGDFQVGTVTGSALTLFDVQGWERKLHSGTDLNIWLTSEAYYSFLGPGNKSLVSRWANAYVEQEFGVDGGRGYTLSVNCYATTAMLEWDGLLQVQWLDSTGSAISLETVDTFEPSAVPLNTWETLSGSVASPRNAVKGRIVLGSSHNGGGTYGYLYFDNAGVFAGQYAPVAVDDAYDVDKDGVLTIDADGVLSNDTDAEGDALMATLVSGTSHGSLSLNSDGSFVYTPSAGYTGPDEFTYRANDGLVDSAEATVEIMVYGLGLPQVFGDNMVLQRNMPIAIWGWSNAGESLTVQIGSGSTVGVTADAGGRWIADLPTMTAGGPHTVTIAGSQDTIVLTNVMLGDVWVCSGQSNMEWKLNSADGGAVEAASADYPDIRHIDVANMYSDQRQEDISVVDWTVCSPSTAGTYTAVGYYFAKNIHLDRNVPIGLINVSWGGTMIEPWAPVEVANARSSTYNQQQPMVLYNAMIHPFVGMGVKGAIWYQGEANISDGGLYTNKMDELITGWRQEWSIGDFPFYYVQLAPYTYNVSDYFLPLFWEAQTNALSIANTGMAVINDIGNIDDIHPRNKADVGYRLALQALYGTYGQTTLIHSGPMHDHSVIEGNSIRVYFDHAESGLVSRDAGELTWFAIAGDDGVYYTANAVISGDTVIVSSASVSNPVYVRFAWSELAEPNLMNVEGLPANSFRATAASK